MVYTSHGALPAIRGSSARTGGAACPLGTDTREMALRIYEAGDPSSQAGGPMALDRPEPL